MLSRVSDEFITNRAWLRDVVNGNELILRRVSALEYLELFNGYLGEKAIDVYAKKKGIYENINYCVIDSFDNIEFIKYGNTLCTSINQTFNDMLDQSDQSDELALMEALSNYYYSNGESFDGLNIKPENIAYFEFLKPSAINYYYNGD